MKKSFSTPKPLGLGSSVPCTVPVDRNKFTKKNSTNHSDKLRLGWEARTLGFFGTILKMYICISYLTMVMFQLAMLVKTGGYSFSFCDLQVARTNWQHGAEACQRGLHEAWFGKRITT